MSCIFAFGEPQGTFVSQSAASRTATPSTTTSSTSTPDEINEPIDISLDGKIFPPSIHADGVKM